MKAKVNVKELGVLTPDLDLQKKVKREKVLEREHVQKVTRPFGKKEQPP